MYISGKVTHSFLTFLAKQSLDFEKLFDSVELPTDFLRDSTCWLEAEKVESFLLLIENQFSSAFPGESIIEKVALSNNELRSWGVLDSVLKMMGDPQDIFNQPQKFISYFISPAPPVANIVRKGKSIQFDLPLSSTEYPCFSLYMKSVFEVIPCFMGRPHAMAHWDQNSLYVDWSSTQKDFFDQATSERANISPELMQNLVTTIETTEKELDFQKDLVKVKDRELSELHFKLSQMELNGGSWSSEKEQSLAQIEDKFEEVSTSSLTNIQNQVLRMSDYLTRAQQLVTLLVGQNRMDKQVQLAMRRVDWESVKERFSHSVQDSLNNVETLRRELKQFKLGSQGRIGLHPLGGLTNLDSLIDRAVSVLSVSLKNRNIFIDRMLFFGKEISIDALQIETFFLQLLEFLSRSVRDNGYMRVASRPKFNFAAIEIVDNGKGLSSHSLQQFLSDPTIQSIIKNHQIEINLLDANTEGSALEVLVPNVGVKYVKNKKSTRPRDHRQ